MRRSSNPLASVFAACLLSLFASVGAAAEAVPPAARELMLQNPGLRVHWEGGRITAIYGRPMGHAAGPAQVAAAWWQQHAEAFGVSDLSLRLIRWNQVGQAGRFSVFAYEQSIDGLPVEGGLARLLVRAGTSNAVVYAAAKLAHAPEGGFLPDAVDAADARARVRAMPDYAPLPEWTEPELVIFNGENNDGPGPSIRAWRFQGGEPGPASLTKYTFFVDAASGRLVHVRNDVYRAVDIFGHVGGMASPGVLPDVPYNPPVETDMPQIRVRILEGSEAYADLDGDYVLPYPGTDPVVVQSELHGLWVTVLNQGGEDLILQQPVTPPGPADFLFNTAPSEFTTSQVNGFVRTSQSHNFFTDRQPDFELLDVPLLCTVNNTGSCDAFFGGNSIIFLRAGSVGEFECPNTCYSSVVAHEYGHFVVSVHGVGGGAFVEGYADAYALLMYDHPLVGADFLGEGTSVRDYTPPCNVYRYPCTGPLPPCGTEVVTQNPSHGCGQLLAGIWWDIKLNFQDAMGPDVGLEYARQLFTDWTGITLGGQRLNSAHPQTAIEVLTVDDDDGDIGDGTPHYAEICAAFAAHRINCPDVLADLDGDGDVDAADLAMLLGSWGPCADCQNCPADLDGDCTVGAADLAILLGNWG